MTDIIFRGKRDDTNKRVYGYFIQKADGSCLIMGKKHGVYNVHPDSVGQFTGLQYKGVDLYGGMRFSYTFDDYTWDENSKRTLIKVETINTIQIYKGSWCVMEDGHDYGEGMPTTLKQWIEDDDSELITD